MSEPGCESERYVALLRGVNVSGQRRVEMAALRRGLEACGLAGVETHVQSGNVVFAAPGERDRSPAALASVVRQVIAAEFGHDVAVLVVPGMALAAIVAGNPFAAEPGVEERHLHVTFLFGSGGCADADAAGLPAVEGERVVAAGPVVYLLLPFGYGRTKLTNAYFERRCATPATTRNWRTVLALERLVAAG
jgi:uncharacterized protein (DUF1697 family)